MAVEAFIRFQSKNGQVEYGEVSQKELSNLKQGTAVKVLDGDPFGGFKEAGRTSEVENVSGEASSVVWD